MSRSVSEWAAAMVKNQINSHPFESQCSLHLLHLPCDEFSAFSDVDPDLLLGDPLWNYDEDSSKPGKGALISL